MAAGGKAFAQRRAGRGDGVGRGGARLGQFGAAGLGDEAAQDFDEEFAPFGQFGRKRLEQDFLAIRERGDAAPGGDEDAGQPREGDGARAHAAPGAFDMRFDDAVIDDEGGAVFADPPFVKPLSQGAARRRPAARGFRRAAGRQRPNGCPQGGGQALRHGPEWRSRPPCRAIRCWRYTRRSRAR